MTHRQDESVRRVMMSRKDTSALEYNDVCRTISSVKRRHSAQGAPSSEQRQPVVKRLVLVAKTLKSLALKAIICKRLHDDITFLLRFY